MLMVMAMVIAMVMVMAMLAAMAMVTPMVMAMPMVRAMVMLAVAVMVVVIGACKIILSFALHPKYLMYPSPMCGRLPTLIPEAVLRKMDLKCRFAFFFWHVRSWFATTLSLIQGIVLIVPEKIFNRKTKFLIVISRVTFLVALDRILDFWFWSWIICALLDCS